ncbi:hypothetical protein AV691_004288 [Salmonella enterica subsp. enterica serovar 4,[5],12:i:-]|nr:hypothetical protein [Salmonella enterica subsp. enterica serovar 4,[5],12:i:-]
MIAKVNFFNYLTKGHDYTVLNSVDNLYLVQGDNGVRVWLDKTLFESKELSNAKKIADEASALAERERIRDIVAEQVRNSCLPGGEIFNHVKGVGGSGWQIKRTGDAIIQSINYEPNEYIKVLEQLREVLRVPEGESIVTHAKVLMALADALIGLQK